MVVHWLSCSDVAMVTTWPWCCLQRAGSCSCGARTLRVRLGWGSGARRPGRWRSAWAGRSAGCPAGTTTPLWWQVRLTWWLVSPGGDRLMCACLAADGALFTFGERDSGKLGLRPERLARHRVPQRVEIITEPVLQVACGGSHTVALTG